MFRKWEREKRLRAVDTILHSTSEAHSKIDLIEQICAQIAHFPSHLHLTCLDSSVDLFYHKPLAGV
jgi:hypothetical protein